MAEDIQKDQTASAPATVAETNTPAPKTSTDSLAKTFSALAAQARDNMKPFRPALAKMNAVISKFHSIGNDQIGLELATFDKLRENNLYRGSMGDSQAHFALLSIYDARFLVRVLPDSKIDCYTENLNKPYGAIFNIDSDAFWYATDNGKTKAMFNSYDLSKDEDVAKFMGAVASINAVLAANDELREFDMPAARDKSPLPKAAPGGLKLGGK